MPLSAADFAKRVRDKNPGAYDDLSDDDLTTRVLRSHPEYADMVDPKATTSPPTVQSPAVARAKNIVTAKGGKSEDHPWLDALDYVGAGLQAVGGLLPDLSADPGGVQYTANVVRTAAGYMAKHPGATGERQAILSAVPIVGAPVAALAEPSIAYNEGRAPTHEENVSAVEGGAALATLIAAPKVIGKVGRMAEARQARVANVLTAKGVPPESIPQFTPEETALTDRAGAAQAAAKPRVSDLEAMRSQMAAAQERIAGSSGSDVEATPPTDDDILSVASRRTGGRPASEAARQSIAEDQHRLSPQAALDRENLPVEEFVRQRFPKATINTDAGPEWVRGVLDKVPAGKPGLSVEDAPPDLLTMPGEPAELQDQGRHVVYRDPDGRPVAAATVVRTSDGALVRDFATDKAQGLLASRAAGAVLRELDKMGVNDHFAEISPEAARFIQRAEAAKARGVLPVRGASADSPSEAAKQEESASRYSLGVGVKAEEGMRSHSIFDPEGQEVGHALVQKDGDVARIEWLGERDSEDVQSRPLTNQFGPATLRELAVQYLRGNPDIKFVEGQHMGGADYGKPKWVRVPASRFLGESDLAPVQTAPPDTATRAHQALPVRETPAPTATAGSEESPPPEPPSPVVAAVTEPTPPPPALPSPDDPAYPSALRTRFSGEKGVRRAEGNVIGNFFRKTMNPVEQEALSLMRDEKGNPGHLKAMLDGTHKAYADAAKVADDAFDTGGRNAETSTERATRSRVAALARIEALRPIIEQAMNPTPAMKQADAMFDAYATKTLAEGRKLGVLDSSITPENYVPHLLQPLEPRTVDVNAGRLRVGGISRRTSFANKRGYPTILEAVAHGVEPRTLNAADAISVYADKHGTAVATKILVDTLKESDIGKFTTRENAPAGWAEVGEGTRTFKNDIAYESGGEDESALAVAHQALYAPPEIAKALKPITDPNYMMQVRGFEQSSAYQAYIKSAELSLSFFHMKALNITALNDMRLGPVDLARAYAAPMDSPAFVDMERNFIQHGGKTSIESQTAEAYRKLTPTSLPTRVDAIRNLPGLRQMDAAAAWTSRVTFEVMQRKFKVIDFASKDAAWIAEHPKASGVEIATARRQLARQVNAAYGGLNWEALGVRRTEMGIARALFLAPDWTYSNVDSGVQAFQGGAGGTAARWFWARSIAGGMAMTAATTYFMTGKRSEEVPGKMRDKLFNVYLGDDKDGNRKYMNMFFAGAPSDLVNLAGNIADYGIGRGIAMTIANKLAPVSRAAEHQLSNQNFMGRDIVPKGAGPVAGTVLSAKALASDLLPVPLTLTNIIQMVTDPKREYSVGEYAAVLAGGVRPRRVKPEAPEPERNSTWDIINGTPVYKGRRG